MTWNRGLLLLQSGRGPCRTEVAGGNPPGFSLGPCLSKEASGGRILLVVAVGQSGPSPQCQASVPNCFCGDLQASDYPNICATKVAQGEILEIQIGRIKLRIREGCGPRGARRRRQGAAPHFPEGPTSVSVASIPALPESPPMMKKSGAAANSVANARSAALSGRFSRSASAKHFRIIDKLRAKARAPLVLIKRHSAHFSRIERINGRKN